MFLSLREMKRIAALRGFHLSHTYMCKAGDEIERGVWLDLFFPLSAANFEMAGVVSAGVPFAPKSTALSLIDSSSLLANHGGVSDCASEGLKVEGFQACRCRRKHMVDSTANLKPHLSL